MQVQAWERQSKTRYALIDSAQKLVLDTWLRRNWFNNFQFCLLEAPMIITDDKQVEALEARRVAEEQPNQEPPPTYSSLSPSSQTLVAKPTNYVFVERKHTSIKDFYLLDPSVFIPVFLRPALLPGETEEQRKNLRLESTHGQVYADVTLVAPEVDDGTSSSAATVSSKKRRVTMLMKSTHGGVTAKIHDSEPNQRAPFHLHVDSVNGNIRIYLPRSFHGPIVVSLRHGSVKFSDGLSQHLTTFGEADNVRRCFVGDFSRWTDRGGGWVGDEVLVDAKHGNVKIQYDDDLVGSPVKSRPSLLNRVFGF